MVFLDCGNDLATSPEGPWLDRKSSRMLPTPKTDPDAMLETMQRSGIGRSAGQDPPIDTRLLQSFSHIHLSYGDSLIAEARAKDPFYLLNELFQQDASCERQILDLIAHKIKNHTIGVDSNMIEADDYKILRSELLHFQSFLEDYVENLQNKIDVIRRRGGTSWSRPVEDHVTQITNSATSLLMEDFEYLLKRANNLLVKIERSISLTMSIAGIEDARRGIEQNTTIFRFTVVASFYIPLSFTTSFFGMNFDELSKGLSLWIFFAASTPVFILSVFCLFIRRSRVERFQRSLSEGISSWTNVTRTPR